MIILAIFLILLVSAIAYVTINFVHYLINGRVYRDHKLWKMVQIWTVIIVPIIFLILVDIPNKNDCCGETAIFSPEHRLQIYILIGASMLAFLISLFRKTILPPILELFLQMFLVLGLIINIILCYHLTTLEDGILYWVAGNLSIILLFIIAIIENQKLLKRHIQQYDISTHNAIGKIALYILNFKAIYKYPILTLLLIPMLVFFSLFLMLFGQKPDSLIRAFTDTYKHGFSELDYMCDNVNCGEHFLCSVGANGHQNIVKPVRYGERHGHKIICNRQLLISNAFEELIQERMPNTHQFIRNQYNKVGNIIHQYYHLFNIKFVSDAVYILMKPLEVIFILTLYTLESNPENRIHRQYLSYQDRNNLNELINLK